MCVFYLCKVQLSDFAADIFSQATGERDHAWQLTGVSPDQLQVGPVRDGDSSQNIDCHDWNSNKCWAFDTKLISKMYPIRCSASIFVWIAPSCPTSLSSSASTSFCIRRKKNTCDEQNEYTFYLDLCILNLEQIHAVQYIFTFSIKTYLINS